ncbi:MAG: peptidase modulator of gyrase [Firmicutes bacterium]|nr:peptidase modulator of gyrase [Bacillota bacterium]
MQYLELAKLAVDKAKQMGAHAAEAYVLDAKSLQIITSKDQVESLKLSEDAGIGIRVISPEGRVGFAYSTEIDASQLQATVSQAINNGENTFADKFNVLPSRGEIDQQLAVVDPSIHATKVEDKIELAKQVERSAKAASKYVKRAERCGYEDAEYQVTLVNSNELAVQYRSGYCGLFGLVLAEDNADIQTGVAVKYSRKFCDLIPETIGQEAAENAAQLLGAKNIGTTKAAVLLSPYVATSFFSVLIPALSADAVHKGRSLFKGKLENKVMSPLISLVDDGLLAGGISTAPIDGEGVAAKRTELISEGVLKSYLYNSYTAAKDNVPSTGNGVRSSFKGVPEIGPTNMFIAAGTTPKDKLVQEVQDGFYVTNVMGMHTANSITGDFSVGASGVWIKNGAFTHAVRGVAIAGNLMELLGEVDGVGNDLRFFGSNGAPTIRFSRITISGS